MRERVVAASKAMKTGDWKQCAEHILAVSCWELFPKSDKVKAMLSRCVSFPLTLNVYKNTVFEF